MKSSWMLRFWFASLADGVALVCDASCMVFGCDSMCEVVSETDVRIAEATDGCESGTETMGCAATTSWPPP